VAALRELSIVFAALIGMVSFHERFGAVRTRGVAGYVVPGHTLTQPDLCLASVFSAQKAPTPFGVPIPVGPSQPARAWHTGIPQAPLLPLVTSNSWPAFL
jgi:hypothetical protein